MSLRETTRGLGIKDKKNQAISWYYKKITGVIEGTAKQESGRVRDKEERNKKCGTKESHATLLLLYV